METGKDSALEEDELYDYDSHDCFHLRLAVFKDEGCNFSLCVR